MLAWLGYLIYRERRMVQQLSAELRHDRESHVQDLVGHATAWRLMSSTSIAAVMQTRSLRVEMPKGRSLPLAFGMNTRLIGSGR